ncbi:hypothetical protein E2C01_033865 [Portunus trituberculatus]|uniref:Uncharacterized protein n=1 Tax=Portunus trituberculatus TaxID=210409 RepID=A0A5B7F4V5_PORTR|nr:hypothetical protein [Portunus trituberculatus]
MTTNVYQFWECDLLGKAIYISPVSCRAGHHNIERTTSAVTGEGLIPGQEFLDGGGKGITAGYYDDPVNSNYVLRSCTGRAPPCTRSCHGNTTPG